jgi:hypothetical protein
MDSKVYAAKILWQYRLCKGKKNSKKKRVCEERTVVFKGGTANTAYKKVLKYAKSQEYDFIVDEKNDVVAHFELVGILDFPKLGIGMRTMIFRKHGMSCTTSFFRLNEKMNEFPLKINCVNLIPQIVPGRVS